MGKRSPVRAKEPLPVKPTNRLGYEDGFLLGLWLGGCLVIAVAVAAFYIGRLL